MNDTIYYVYAICAAAAVGELPAPLIAVTQGDLAALVELKPVAEYGPGAFEEHVRDMAWLEQAVVAHQAGVATLYSGRDLVPMRFGTIFLSAENLRAMLAANAAALSAALARLAGCDEWGVRVQADPAALAEVAIMQSPRARELRDGIATKPAGAAFMLSKQLDRLVANEVERLRDSLARDSHSRLASAAAAAVTGSLAARAPDGPLLLLNGAYLLPRAEQAAFADALDRLRAEYSPLGLAYQLSGPWPGYSFASLDAENLKSEI